MTCEECKDCRWRDRNFEAVCREPRHYKRMQELGVMYEPICQPSKDCGYHKVDKAHPAWDDGK